MRSFDLTKLQDIILQTSGGTYQTILFTVGPEESDDYAINDGRRGRGGGEATRDRLTWRRAVKNALNISGNWTIAPIDAACTLFAATKRAEE